MSSAIRDPVIRRVFTRHPYAISRSRDVINSIEDIINIPVIHESLTVDSLMRMVGEIFSGREHSFRLNFSFGLI